MERQPIARAETAQALAGTAGVQEELPRTASPLALTGLIGLLSLGGALGLHRRGRRRD